MVALTSRVTSAVVSCDRNPTCGLVIANGSALDFRNHQIWMSKNAATESVHQFVGSREHPLSTSTHRFSSISSLSSPNCHSFGRDTPMLLCVVRYFRAILLNMRFFLMFAPTCVATPLSSSEQPERWFHDIQVSIPSVRYVCAPSPSYTRPQADTTRQAPSYSF